MLQTAFGGRYGARRAGVQFQRGAQLDDFRAKRLVFFLTRAVRAAASALPGLGVAAGDVERLFQQFLV